MMGESIYNVCTATLSYQHIRGIELMGKEAHFHVFEKSSG